MNPASETPPPINPLALPPPNVSPPVTAADLMRWLRLLLGRNPFYILSAVLLLYSMRLLSVDSMASAKETPQLLFNFSCFQFYELLLAGTAIFLAGRKIWYDSGLLIGVENLFLFVPFILISQALLLSNAIALELCLAVCVLAGGRALWIKRWLPKANLPPLLVVFGGFLLCLNVAIPIAIRLLHQNANVRIWDERGDIIRAVEWSWLMPLLMAAALALPNRKTGSNHEALYTRRLFPLLALTMWLAGTGAHLYCIGYVYGLPWDNRLLVPVVWMAAWVLWCRRADLDFLPDNMASHAAGVLLAAPALVLLVAECGGLGSVIWLCALSAAAYIGIAAVKGDRLAVHLACVSLALLVGGLPVHSHHTIPTKGGDFLAAELASGVLVFYLVLLTLLSPRPGFGLLGGAMLTGLVAGAFPGEMMSWNAAINVGLVFAVLHSLRWQDGAPERRVLAVIWLGQCLVWLLMDSSAAGRGTLSAGLAVLAVFLAIWAIQHLWGPRAILWSALGAMAMLPLRSCVVECQCLPIGVLILCGSFVLFGIGTLVALTRERWLPRHPPIAAPATELQNLL